MLSLSRKGSDWREVPRRLRLLETPSQRLHDWGRLLVRTKGIRMPSWRGAFEILRGGSFGSSIYSAACLLHFFWDEVGTGLAPGNEIAETLGAILGVSGESGMRGRRELAGRIFHSWQCHLRDNPL